MVNMGMQFALNLNGGCLPNLKCKVFFIAFFKIGIGINIKKSCYVYNLSA